MMKVASIIFLGLLSIGSAIAAPKLELPIAMMRNTFEFKGDNGAFGTAFIMSHPYFTEKDSNTYAIMFSAAHVFDSLSGDSATLIVRFLKTDGYRKINYRMPIRINGVPLWIKHPEADIAAMPLLALPELVRDELVFIPTRLIADDQYLENANILPGDKVFVLGYPLGLESNDYGFPVLRTGYIASYPVYPSKKEKRILIDFKIFQGNSGGPVFLEKEVPWLKADTLVGVITSRMLFGIVIEDRGVSQQFSYLDGTTEKRRYSLDIAAVVPAVYMKELLDIISSLILRK